MNKIRQISKEHGRPFDEIVKEYARLGKSRLVVAGLLGIDYSWFLHLLRTRNLFDCFLPQQVRRGNETDSPRWPKGMPRLSSRKPIEHGGLIWYPGEPMHHYLYSKKRKAA